MNEVSVTDLYEAAYYLSNGCELVEIIKQKLDGKINCQLVFSGPEIIKLQLAFFQGKAVINLFSFRRAFGQVNTLVFEAKKKAKARMDNGGEL